MLGDFFVRAIVAGVGVAAVAGPLGCFIVWRRLAYFGDTLAHAALLGVALALMFEIDTTLSVFVVCLVLAILLMLLRRSETLSSDALLGLLAHSSLALGLVCLSFLTWVRVDLLGLLFGDILAVSRMDIAVIYLGGAVVLAILAIVWRSLFAATVSEDLAAAEGISPERSNIVFTFLLSVVIAIALKIVGALLITALLIIPAAAARRLSTAPEQMAIFAAVLGIISVVSGLELSRHYDTPSGPSIVVAAMFVFVACMIPVANVVSLVRRKISGDNL